MKTATESNLRSFRPLSVRDTAALLAVTPRTLRHMVRGKELPVSAIFWTTLVSTTLASGVFSLLVGPLMLLLGWH